MAPWQPDEPFELPSGQLVCGLHHLKICGYCCVDYTFMSEEEKDPNSDHYIETTRFAVQIDDFHSNLSLFLPSPRNTTELEYRSDGTLVVPSIGTLNPRSATATPQELFPPSTRATRQWPRFISHANDRDFLIFTDGACLNNGPRNPKAGWGFVFRGPTTGYPLIGTVSGRLENQGPSGEAHPQTSNRAELRAVIAALKFRSWVGEGWSSLVLVTDSEYVTKGATKWVRTWEQMDGGRARVPQSRTGTCGKSYFGMPFKADKKA